MSVPVSLRNLKSFGDVAAEDDAVLKYFLTTDAVSALQAGNHFVVLGRKGSGKTALVRHFSEGESGRLSKALNLRSYPWMLHAQRIDSGASNVEAYVSSWTYLIAVEVAALVLNASERPQSENYLSLKKFFDDNYGGINPLIADILRPKKLNFSKLNFHPTVMGNGLGSIELDRLTDNMNFGHELSALATALLRTSIAIAKNETMQSASLHFDELDQGLESLDDSRKRMLIGLVLAVREIRRTYIESGFVVSPTIYLRTDLWDGLQFSDKNKITESSAVKLDWTSENLKNLVDARIKVLVSPEASWDSISDKVLMRGSQSKWSHIISRTFLRPRDVIKFLNAALNKAKLRSDDPLLYSNPDIVNARDEYSAYLKRELDDEILPHWSCWDEALQALSAISTLIFDRNTFLQEYKKKSTPINGITAEDALALLYRFSVIGYEKRSGYGGSSWVFNYSDYQAGWDSTATKFKVHPGLKEYAKLSETRQHKSGSSS